MTYRVSVDSPPGIILHGELPALADLGNLGSIRSDLAVVEALCDALAEWHPAVTGELSDPLKPRAYWESAVITYGRCFSGGRSEFPEARQVRCVPPALMEQLTDAERETHRWAMRERDKHIAHRVDPEGEQVTVAAAFVGDDIQILLSGNRIAARRPDWCAALGRLASRLNELIAAEMNRAVSEIIDSLRSDDNLPRLREVAQPLPMSPPGPT